MVFDLNAVPGTCKYKILKSYFKSRNYIQNEKHGPYFEVSAIQASSDILT